MRRLWARFRRSRVGMTFAKFFAGSMVGTAISQLVLITLYGIGGTSAVTASMLAFVAGAVPNFFLNRRWAWGRIGTEGAWREMVPYAVVVTVGGLTASGLSSFAEHLIRPVVESHVWRTAILDLAYLTSFGLVFVFKFALLDRFVFHRAPNGRAGAEDSADEAQTHAATSSS